MVNMQLDRHRFVIDREECEDAESFGLTICSKAESSWIRIVGSGRLDGGRSVRKYKEWRFAVLERDKWQCQGCFCSNYLEAHHIIAWEANYELRYEESNGITYCRGCHAGVHKKARLELVNA